MTNDEKIPMSNDETRSGAIMVHFRHLSFGFRISFAIRHSSFVIGHVLTNLRRTVLAQIPHAQRGLGTDGRVRIFDFSCWCRLSLTPCFSWVVRQKRTTVNRFNGFITFHFGEGKSTAGNR